MKIEDFLNSQGRVSSTKTTEKYVSKKFPQEFIEVKEHSKKIGLAGVTFSEEVYHYLNQISSPVKCKECLEKKTMFQGLSRGYRDYCSLKCSNNSEDVKIFKEASYLQNFGVSNPSKSNVIKEKIKNTFQDRYGGNPFSVFSEKIKETNNIKYGSSHPLSRNSSLRKDKNKKLLENFLEKYKDFEILDYEDSKWGSCRIWCKSCSMDFSISKWNLYQRISISKIENPCTICNPIGGSKETGIENFIQDILDKNGITYLKRDRKILEGKEIDFYIPEKKLAIEVNGIFWHSDKFKDKFYHSDKTNLANSKGIQLIHIFEDEIEKNPDLVKSRIESILGIYNHRIFARNCRIEEISSRDCNNFLNENHLQGKSGSKIRLGLFFEDKLVSVMTFGDLRRSLGNKSKKGQWELIRFANERGTIVIGGASKLLSYFSKNYCPEKIISYCDRRWSNGNFYEKIGFKKDGETRPNYWYTKNKIREGRFKFRKDRLVSEGYSPEKSESKIMEERGFFRIYDCGSFRFILDYTKNP